MLSDALFEAGELLDHYIADEFWRQRYSAKILVDVDAVRTRMREIQTCLDHLPTMRCGYCEAMLDWHK
ncbi:MAG TPA: hypothetical protein VMU69_12745 [Bradyrhizobium sp.]|nr:hypothetical protein [Bradyrhizobium sp.]